HRYPPSFPTRRSSDLRSIGLGRRFSILALRPIAPAHYLHLVLHRLMVRLLIIDDDTELCALLKEFLHREGFFVFLEHDGAAGLEDRKSTRLNSSHGSI